MGILDLNKLNIMRKKHNQELINKMRNGESLRSFDSQASWFPPRPVLKKDEEAMSRLYTQGVSSRSPSGRAKKTSVSYLFTSKISH